MLYPMLFLRSSAHILTYEGWRPHHEPMTELVGILGVGDPGANFFVVLPPGPFSTFFGLELRCVG